MESDAPTVQSSSPGGRRRLGRPRLMIVGCGDIGLRIVARLNRRFRIFAVTSSPGRSDALRAAGAVPLVADLDGPRPRRLGALAPRAIYLAPPPASGSTDPRLASWLASQRRRSLRLVYVSTTGVYGDRRGHLVDESATALPASERAVRRLDAERRARARPWNASVLRAPGIYGPGRMPLERLRRGLPVPAEVVMTNHIHADDLARLCARTLFAGAPRRLYNAVDDTRLSLADYLDLVADRAGLPRPVRRPRSELAGAVSPMQLSFMSESRLIANRRMKTELKFRLAFPTVADALPRCL
jgi:nucleoside-diphosphate-sugar epimerase